MSTICDIFVPEAGNTAYDENMNMNFFFFKRFYYYRANGRDTIC